MDKRHLIITSELKSSGPNNVIKSLLSESLDDNIFLTSMRKRYDINFKNSLNLPNKNIIPQSNFFSFLHVLSTIRRIRPLTVNTHGIRADLYVYLISFFIKFNQVSTIHNIPNQDYLFRYGKLTSSIMLFFHSIIFKSKSVKKIAVSNQVKLNLIDKFNAKNISTIYNGVDPKKFTPYNSTSKLKFTNNNNLSISREKVLFCGHLSDLKDPLIVANCSTHFPQLDFIFLGSGPLEEKLNMIAENNTNIFIMGKVNNVNEFLSIADYFIMPSHTEGMPMALIEALLCNLPAICSDIPIFKEVSNLDQFNIELFEVKNNKDLIRAISSMIQKNKIHTKNREIALNYFTSSIMYKKYLEIFNE